MDNAKTMTHNEMITNIKAAAKKCDLTYKNRGFYIRRTNELLVKFDSDVAAYEKILTGFVETLKTGRQYYAFKGQNASEGYANRQTGRMSFYGDNHVFETTRQRDDFVADNDHGIPGEICVACTKSELREYNLGMTVAAFEDDLQLKFDRI